MINVFEEVASGGQATVHVGVDDAGNRVAVKILKAEYCSDVDHVERFRREILLMQKLVHPGIVTVTELNMADKRPAYFMPWATTTLQKEIDDNPWGLPEVHILSTYRAVLDAVEFAHNGNVLHRDIKPDNILFVDGVVKVSDFGLARTLDSYLPPLTQSHVRLGTQGYAAPEIWAGGAKNADVAADIFALGALLFHMFSVTHPTVGMNINLVPSQYRDLIVRATDVDPARRYSSVADLISALELRLSGAAALQVPEEIAIQLIATYQQGDVSAAKELLDLLCDNKEDSQLYLNITQKITVEIVQAMQVQSGELLLRVLETFYGFLAGQHPFVATDAFAEFLERAWDGATDVRIKRSILQPLLLLGWSHNRYAVRSIFVRVASKASRDGECVFGLAETLRENPEARLFVKEEMLHQSLPPIIVSALNEEPPASSASEGTALWRI